MTPARVLRIDWLPGADVLDAHCFCGSRWSAPDPVAAWTWLLAHPLHDPTGPTGRGPADPTERDTR